MKSIQQKFKVLSSSLISKVAFSQHRQAENPDITWGLVRDSLTTKRTAPMESEMQLSVTEEELEIFPEPYQETPQEKEQTKRPTPPKETAEPEDKNTTHTVAQKKIPSLLSLKVKPVGLLLYATKRHGPKPRQSKYQREPETL